MSDNNGSGWFGGLLLGVGFSAALLAPFYIGYRYGVHILAGIGAVLATLYAVFSPELVAMANEFSNCGSRCLAAPVSLMILELDKIGWWWIAGVMWAGFALTLYARVVRNTQVGTSSTSENAS